MGDYKMSDIKIKNNFDYCGLNISFFRIAAFVVRDVDVDEVSDVEQAENSLYLQFKLIDKDAGFTSGQTNAGVVIKKEDFYEFKEDYERWVDYYENEVNQNSFFAGEKKQVERMVKEIEERSIKTMERFYEEIIGKQEQDSINRLNSMIEKIEILNLEQERLLQQNKLLKEGFESMHKSLQLFTDDLSDIQEENEELMASKKMKDMIENQ